MSDVLVTLTVCENIHKQEGGSEGRWERSGSGVGVSVFIDNVERRDRASADEGNSSP